MLIFSAAGCSDTAVGNDLWDNVTSSKVTSDKQITSFTINGYKARISGTTVKSVLPCGTSVTALAPVITHNGAAISPESGTVQDFSSPVTYTVTATDGTTEKHTVSVKVLTVAEMSNANLSALKVKKGKLQPDFSPATLSYLDAPIPFSDSANPAYNDKQSNSLIADPEILIATMKINGVAVENAEEYLISNLAVGSNNIEIIVTAVDGTTQLYKLKMYRAIPIFKTGAGNYSGMNALEDGATQRGVNWPTVRFTNNGDGTITDNMTGLMWSRNAKINNIENTFDDSINGTNTLSLGGYTNWRLPNVLEISSLLSYNMSLYDYLSSFSTPSAYFTGLTGTDMWWTSTTDNTTNKGYLLEGLSCDIIPNAKNSIYYHWAVRGNTTNIPKTGQTNTYYTHDDGDLESGVVWPDPRFCNNSDGTITDNMTSLMWFSTPPSSNNTWEDTLSIIENTINPDSMGGNFGYSDWYLPNIKEFTSLLNYGAKNGSDTWSTWMNFYGFSLTNAIFWTSTSRSNASSQAYYLDFDNMNFRGFAKPGTFNFLPVRQARIINY